MIRRLILTALAATWVGCLPEPPEVGDPELEDESGSLGDNAGDGVSFRTLEATLFKENCATSYCHSGNPPPAAPMSLEEGKAYDALVNVASVQANDMKRVTPGDPERSYLLHKVKGTAKKAGGNHSQMPLKKNKLKDKEIKLIEAWIERGAPND